MVLLKPSIIYIKGIKFELVMDEGGSVMGDMLGSNAQTAMVGIFEKAEQILNLSLILMVVTRVFHLK